MISSSSGECIWSCCTYGERMISGAPSRALRLAEGGRSVANQIHDAKYSINSGLSKTAESKDREAYGNQSDRTEHINKD